MLRTASALKRIGVRRAPQNAYVMEAIKKDQKLELFVTQLNKINTQIDNIEKQYPFIVTTIIAVVSLISTILVVDFMSCHQTALMSCL